MDSYPKELLEGVSPLIFAVDAVLNKRQNDGADTTNTGTTSEGAEAGVNVNANAYVNAKSSIFESFYNSIASKKSIDELNKNASNNSSNNTTTKTKLASSSSMIPSLSKPFRFASLYSSATSNTTSSNSSNSIKKGFFSHAHIVPVSHRHAFPPSKDPHGNKNSNLSLNTRLYKSITSKSSYQPPPSSSLLKRNTSTSGSGSGGASIVSSVTNSTMASTAVGSQYSYNTYPNVSAAAGGGGGGGSMHNVGSSNSTVGGGSGNLNASGTGSNHSISNHNQNSNDNSNNDYAKQQRIIDKILSRTPIQGILPSGWLEKHVHALPSTLLFVTELDVSNNSSNNNSSNSNSTGTSSSSSSGTTTSNLKNKKMGMGGKSLTPSKLGKGTGGGMGMGIGGGPLLQSYNNNSLYDQALLEQHLLRTIENITSTVAKKRDVPVHLVILVKTNGTGSAVSNSASTSIAGNHNGNGGGGLSSEQMIQLQERVNSIKTVLRLNSNAITVLHYTTVESEAETASASASESGTKITLDEQTGTATTTTTTTTMKYNMNQLSKLQQTIYEGSNLYYLTQVRRLKRKYALLHHDKIYDLLPFAIRYCIKIAIFYEFQCCLHNNISNSNSNSSGGNTNSVEEEEEKLKREKSVKYWKEAYRNIIDYYYYLIEKEMEARENDGNHRVTMEAGTSGRDKDSNVQNADKTPKKRNAKKIVRNSNAALTDTDDEGDGDEGGNAFLSSDIEEHDNNDDLHGKGESTLLESSPPSPPPDPPSAGVEVALVYSPKSGNGGITIGAKTPIKASGKGGSHDQDDNNEDEKTNFVTHSADMIYQCRAVADWLNLKLLLVLNTISGSATNLNAKGITTNKSRNDLSGMMSLANQVRTHSQVFLSKPMTLTYGCAFQHLIQNENESNYNLDEVWYFWQYVAHQRQVFSEFTEQFTNEPSNVLLKFEMRSQLSPVKHYMSTGESLLQLGLAIWNEMKVQQQICGHELSLEKQNLSHSSSADNRQRFVGSLAVFELSTKFEEEKVRDHLEIALESLNHALKLMDKEDLSSKAPNKLLYARLHYLIGGVLMKQGKFQEAIEPLQKSLSASLVFPSLHALLKKALIKCYKTATSDAQGTNTNDHLRKMMDSLLSLILDTQTNDILSKSTLKSLMNDIFTSYASNLSDQIVEWPFEPEEKQPIEFVLTFPNQSYAIEGDEVIALLQLHSNLKTPVHLSNILIEPNFDVIKIELQSGLNCVLKPNSSIQVSVKVLLPGDFSKNVDQKLVQIQTLKTEKPKMCGLTMIGGGVYSQKKKGMKKILRGGICVGCAAIQINLTLPNSNAPSVKIRIHSAHRGSIPPPPQNNQQAIKRSTLEDDNFIYSAWGRPSSFPMSSGPRCLRVVCAQPDLEIVDLTTSATKGKLMEGTVNRIMLKITAGPTEYCKNMMMSVLCSSSFEEESSKSKSLLDQEQQSNINPAEPSRIPQLVEYNDNKIHQNQKENFPSGWTVNIKNSGRGSRDDWKPVIDTLKGSSVTYASFDLFRPLSEYQEKEQRCITNFLVTIKYSQIRPNQCGSSKDGDVVVQEYRGSATWCSPINADVSFLPAMKKVLPSGNRHQSNSVSNTGSVNDDSAILSGGKALLRCTLAASDAINNLGVVLKNVAFETNGGEETKCNVELVPFGKGHSTQSNLLYSPESNAFCRNLNAGTKVNVAYAVRATVASDNVHPATEESIINARLGAVSVSWSPVPLQLPDPTYFIPKDEYGENYGPLRLQQVMPVKQRGPTCYIEVTPFEATFKTIPPMPKVGSPFEVRYEISNKTNLHQRLRVLMNDSDAIVSSNSMLVSGVINGEIVLGPLEKKILSYSLLVTKVGKITIPAFDVSSVRYNTWVIHHRSSMDKVFVSP